MYHDTIKTEEAKSGLNAVFAGFIKGVFQAVVVTVIVFFAVACLMRFTALSEGVIPFVAIAMQAAGAFLAGHGTVKGLKRSALLSGFLSGVAYCLLLWLAASLAGGGFYVGKHFFTMLIFSAVAGALGGVFAVNRKSGRSNRRKR